MMKAALLLFAMLSISMALLAQAPAPLTAANPTVVRWAENAAGASVTVQGGMRIEALRIGGILIKVSPLNEVAQQFTQTWVGIVNSGPDAAELHAGASVEVLKPNADTLAAVPAGKVAKVIATQGGVAAQVLTNTEQGGDLGCKGAQITDCVPTGSGSTTQAAKDRGEVASGQARWAQEHGLGETRLTPGVAVQGAIFFPRGKIKEYVVRVPVGNYVFEFPFGPKDGGKH